MMQHYRVSNFWLAFQQFRWGCRGIIHEQKRMLSNILFTIRQIIFLWLKWSLSSSWKWSPILCLLVYNFDRKAGYTNPWRKRQEWVSWDPFRMLRLHTIDVLYVLTHYNVVSTIENFSLQIVAGISKVCAMRDNQNSSADQFPPFARL